VRTTDLALSTGSVIRPFACSRLRVSQSKPFQALVPSCRVKYRSARTVSSIFSVSISMVRPFEKLVRTPHSGWYAQGSCGMLDEDPKAFTSDA
jgi:hypothetical protein